MHTLEGVGVRHVGTEEQRRRDDQHRRVDQPGQPHPEHHVERLVAEQVVAVGDRVPTLGLWVSAECR